MIIDLGLYWQRNGFNKEAADGEEPASGMEKGAQKGNAEFLLLVTISLVLFYCVAIMVAF